jgi:hypothetical protein
MGVSFYPEQGHNDNADKVLKKVHHDSGHQAMSPQVNGSKNLPHKPDSDHPVGPFVPVTQRKDSGREEDGRTLKQIGPKKEGDKKANTQDDVLPAVPECPTDAIHRLGIAPEKKEN